MVPIGDLPGGNVYGIASAISPDGRVVVGRGSTGRFPQAFWWTAGTGMINLGGLPETDRPVSWANDVSADGGVVVGDAEHRLYHVAGAAVWDATRGMLGQHDRQGFRFPLNAAGRYDRFGGFSVA